MLNSARKILAAFGIIQALAFPGAASEVRSDETVVFFPSIGWRNADNSWTLQIRGWIFEQEKRPGVATLFRKVVRIDPDKLSETEKKTFQQRTRLFLIDAERGKTISIQLGENEFALNKSSSNGHFEKEIQLPDSEIQKLQTNGAVSFTAILNKKDSRTFPGIVYLLPPAGISVISDIDDTIKISNVREREKLLQNTFCRPFAPAPGMAALYRDWGTNANTAFHFVSASPSQLCPPLTEFLSENGFPSGSLHLSIFDWKKQIFHKDTPIAASHKPKVIEPLLKQFPQRQFILVGDSGELDPEIYGELARKSPEQVQRIFIRDVTNDASERYEKAFRHIPAAKWKVFQDPEEIKSSLP